MIKKTSKPISFTFPPDLALKLEAITHIGYYDSVSEFVRDTIRTFLNQREDIRTAIAIQLYNKEKVNLAKAAEIAKLPIEEFKKILHHYK